ncbi:MAG TPA: hypothetical protein VFO35_02590 [Steroidobacteraceae bacterium]|nr:hypothetical protein [Steroidobacteraceae bacterium]
MTSSQLSTLKLSIVCALGLGVSALAPPASAASSAGPYYAEASLATAAPAADKEVDGVKWTCEGDKCVGKAERRSSLDSYMKECRKVAANLGKLTRFFSRGREMSARDLENCNRAAS